MNAKVMTPEDSAHIQRLFDESDLAFERGQDSLALTYLIDATIESRNKVLTPLTFRVELTYARVLLDLGLPKLALQNLRHLEYLIEGRGVFYFRRVNSSMGGIYLKMENYDAAKRAYLKVYQKDPRPRDSYHMISPLNNLGYTYYLAGDLDSAQIFLDAAMSNLLENKPEDTLFKGIIKDNMALIAIEKGLFKDALKTFSHNLFIQKEEKRYNKYFPTILKVADAYSRMGIKDSADHYFSFFRSEMVSFSGAIRAREGAFWKKYYPTYIEHMKRLGSLDALQKSQLSYFRFQDSLRLSNSKSLDIVLSQIQRLMEKSRHQNNRIVDLEHQKTVEHLDRERQRSRAAYLTTALVIMGAVLLIVVLIVIVRNRIKRSKREAESLEAQNKISELRLENEALEKIKLQQKLKLQRKESTDLALEIKRKREWVKEIRNQLSTVQSDGDIKKTLQSFLPGINIDDKQELFLERVDELNESFYDELLRRFPDLTPAEKELCGLIRLKLSSKEIAASRQITVNAVKVARRRLRKKLAINPKDDLYVFIASV